MGNGKPGLGQFFGKGAQRCRRMTLIVIVGHDEHVADAPSDHVADPVDPPRSCVRLWSYDSVFSDPIVLTDQTDVGGIVRGVERSPRQIGVVMQIAAHKRYLLLTAELHKPVGPPRFVSQLQGKWYARGPLFDEATKGPRIVGGAGERGRHLHNHSGQALAEVGAKRIGEAAERNVRNPQPGLLG